MYAKEPRAKLYELIQKHGLVVSRYSTHAGTSTAGPWISFKEHPGHENLTPLLFTNKSEIILRIPLSSRVYSVSEGHRAPGDLLSIGSTTAHVLRI